MSPYDDLLDMSSYDDMLDMSSYGDILLVVERRHVMMSPFDDTVLDQDVP